MPPRKKSATAPKVKGNVEIVRDGTADEEIEHEEGWVSPEIQRAMAGETVVLSKTIEESSNEEEAG